jgi:hypothetical protein
MQFQPVTKSIETFGISQSKKMTILSSAKMFNTLISGLYSRKIESIVREITSNARDGHAKRGNMDRPFFVHSPTRWEPWFSVRDYGSSIDHDTVLEHCSQIGWSSKEDSNLEVGTFGYGMKSPFAYTSQFMLTCFLDGEARAYSYHIGEDGAPEISLRETTETDAEQGVELRFDVKSWDIDAFQRAIRWAGLPYNPCFESNLDNVRTAVIKQDEGTVFFSPDATGPMVEIGPVWYKIDFSQLPDCADIAEALQKDSSLVLRSTIGDLGITPSRESLEYTPKTVANLTKTLMSIHAQMQARVTALIATSTDVWDAAKKWGTFDGPLFSFMAGNTPTQWGKFSSLRTFTFGYGLDEDVAVMTQLTDSIMKKKMLSFTRGIDTAIYVFDQREPTRTYWRRRVLADMKAKDIDTAVYVYLPCPKLVLATTMEQLTKNNVDRVQRKIKLKGLYERTMKRRADLEKEILAYGCPVIVKERDLPEPEKIVYDRATSNIAIYRPDRNKWASCNMPRNLDENKMNLVFSLDDREFFPRIDRDDVAKLAKKYCDLDVGHIVGISKSNVKKFLAGNPEWTDYREVFNDKFIDVPALKVQHAALNELDDHYLKNFDDDAEEISKKLAILPTIPTVINGFIQAVTELKTTMSARRLARLALLKTGASESDCEVLTHLVTGKRLDSSAYRITPRDQIAKDAQARMKKLFPKVTGYYGPSETVVYVLGTEALHALRAATFYDMDEVA